MLRAKDLRVEVDLSDNRMQNKIRLAQDQKIPYMLILGDREAEAKAATVRVRGAARDAAQETLSWEAIADRLSVESATRRV
ncbi:MAG TPA: His/Gly/Thr/Pro-type tRNA ligase C-terminal domain-containing protein [Candidatus Limnocylindrales bacterium]|nr:His/Gly/Thr/Pro-type tRNA ligase C-terminal domain-containing protein [Candidatus Limnocylindrales bacterium]